MFVDLPKIGQDFQKNDVVASVESVKAASDIIMPVAGKITEINGALENDPSTVNASAENKGWFIKFEAQNKADLDSLMDEDKYEELLESLD